MFMSRRVTQLALLGITLSLTATVTNAAPYPKHVEKNLIAVCEAVKSDSRLRLHRAVKATGFKMRYIHEGLVCNGQDMLTFALTHNASKNAQLIARRINASPSVLTAKR
ncbi:hypothetical protein KUL17_01190 [Alteromonas sp. KUL17]|uniref:DUF3718 domain-containing protein n=1 Tax=Alteromonas sp. KUL17 TaxID=2480796 RepID=UPI001037232F|nr:DUF3718 domain-containing protein [Alteromonas sp. KUL17]TAP31098.1 DUF3718 domain-containing protein [Alteromonas sp. KUL17]GEA01222.1 hypothetical protein KUL17_01190 [Alteromonas sp. KUL17]